MVYSIENDIMKTDKASKTPKKTNSNTICLSRAFCNECSYKGDWHEKFEYTKSDVFVHNATNEGHWALMELKEEEE